MRARISLYVAVFLVGFCGLLTQVVVVREMVVTFYGSELSIGVMLGSWLLWTGLGSLGLGRLVRWSRRPRLWLATLLVVGAAAMVATVVGARLLKLLVGLSGETVGAFLGDPLGALGEVAGFVARPGKALERLAAAREATVGQVRPFRLMLVSCLGLLGPFCLLNGFLFPLGCRAVGAGSEEAKMGPGRVYVAEAAGAAVGGACYSFLLVHWVEPLVLAFLMAGSWCVGSALVAWGGRRGLAAKVVGVVAAAGGGLAGAASFAGAPPMLGREIEQAYWLPRRLVSTKDSRYGRVVVVRPPQEAKQCSLFHNGTLCFTYPDPPAAEAVAHLIMAEHPQPRNVLMLGGGLGGVLGEVLRHPSVERVTYVELDPLVVAAVAEHFAPAASRPLASGPGHAAGEAGLPRPAAERARSRVQLVIGDGRALLKRTRERYDVVIDGQPSPTTAQANRYYTLGFFREVAGVLAPGGLLAFRASGSLSFASEASEGSRRLLACLHRTVSQVFPAVIAFPGAEVQFLASNRREVLTYDVDELDERLAVRGIFSPYANATQWAAQFMGRETELDAVFAARPPPALNRDLAPRCYYYEALHWSALLHERLPGARPPRFDLGRLLVGLDRQPALAPLAVLGVVVLVALVVLLARRCWRDAALAFAVTSTGLVEMAVEFVVLLGFQVAYGYVYQYVGVLMAAFMLGLTAGGWLSSRSVRRGTATWGRLVWVQGGLFAYPLCLLGFLSLATRTALAVVPLFAALSFSVVALAAGLVGGLQFPLATAHHSARERSAGTLYGLDLFGSCLGALAVSSVLVPVFGLASVCVMLSALAGLGLVGLLATGRWTTG